MDDDLLSIFQDAVLHNKYSASEIAAAIHKPYPTLMRECNPYDSGAKLGAKTLFDIMAFTSNVEPLRSMAHRLGYELKVRKVHSDA